MKLGLERIRSLSSNLERCTVEKGKRCGNVNNFSRTNSTINFPALTGGTQINLKTLATKHNSNYF